MMIPLLLARCIADDTARAPMTHSDETIRDAFETLHQSMDVDDVIATLGLAETRYDICDARRLRIH